MRGALAAVSARAVIARACRDASFSPDAPLTVLAAGKAAAAMSAALGGIHAGPLDGIAIGTHATARLPLRWIESAHPVPDARSERAARAALDLARSPAAGGRLLVLLSGGASALMALPADEITLEDKQRATRMLLAGGADIGALNSVRKHISAIKGGRLAQACPGQVETWLLSDVVGDDPAVIASGPTVPDPSTFADALAVLDRHGGRGAFPPSIVTRLLSGAAGDVPETPKSAADLPRTMVRVIGSAHDAVEGAAEVARGRGYDVVWRPTPVVGEARVAAGEHLAWVRAHAGRPGRPLCVLSSGETTVHVTGAGKGGRNQELALALVQPLAGSSWLVASLGTDGVDGPTDAAGAWVDGSTAARAAAAGLDPIAYLLANDAWTFFRRIGGSIVTGPSDTNVGDVQVALIGPPGDARGT